MPKVGVDDYRQPQLSISYHLQNPKLTFRTTLKEHFTKIGTHG